MNKPFYNEYEDYAKVVVDDFIKQCSMENYYWDLVNSIRENDPHTYHSFRTPNEASFINLLIDESFNTPSIKQCMNERQKDAQNWLSNNLLKYNDWLLKYKHI